MKPLNKLALTVSIIFSILIASSAGAQDRAAAIDSIFSWVPDEGPGCVCAVSQQGQVVYRRAYGLADLERKIPLSEHSIFDIGSAHKQFIAAAVLLLAEEKRLSLSDDIRKYIPQLPDYGQPITVNHLLTHTSGLRDWTGLLALTEGNPDVLSLILRQQELNFPPGEQWSYSNSGYVLAREIVARVSGMPFGEFVRKRIFEPLGMLSTSYSVTMRDTGRHRALAYEKEGSGWKLWMRLDNKRGGGGVLSTASDLLTWNAALTNGKLGKFVTEKLQEPARLKNGRELKYARGLMVDPYRDGIPMVAHSGGSAGYSTWLGRFPRQRLSIAVLCNGEPVSSTKLAHRIADLFLPASGIAEVEADGPPPAIPAGIDVQGRAGLYINEKSGELLHLVTERGYFRIAGGPGLVVIGKDRFRRWGTGLEFMSQDAFEISFASPDEFELKSMDGETRRYRRPKPPGYSAEDLQQFAGRYKSDEVGSVFRVEAGSKGLSVRLDHAPERALEFEAVGPGVFQWNKRMVIRFRQDASGKVTSMDYTNPVLRKLSFLRQ